jgi:cystathionine beta-synthase
MTKFISDKWMIELGFMEPPNDRPALAGKVVRDIQLQSAITITPEVPCSEALNIMSTQGFDQLPVVDDEKVVGVVTVGGTLSKLATKRASVTDPCRKIMYPGVKVVSPNTPLEKVSVMFETHSFLIVQDDSSVYILSPIDLAKYMASLE